MKLEIIELTKSYAQTTVFDNWSFKFGSHCYALVGNNGSGKSTLLEILAGVERFNSGKILFQNKDLLNHPLWYKQQTGYCPDRLIFYSFLTVNDFFRLVAKIKGIPPIEKNDPLITGFNIAEKFDTTLDKLSLGMQKKVLLATALQDQPKVLLLDEPTDELDKESKAFLIKLLQCRKDTITILATHDEDLIHQLTAEVIKLG